MDQTILLRMEMAAYERHGGRPQRRRTIGQVRTTCSRQKGAQQKYGVVVHQESPASKNKS